jgi:peroxiredoxin
MADADATTRRELAGVVIAIATILLVPKESGAAMAELLEKVNLSVYSRPTIPPDFDGRTVDNREMSLRSLQGKVVALNFWATWCLECRPEMPGFERLHREFSPQGLAVIGINAREGRTAIRAYAKDLGLSFPLVLDSSGNINSTYGVIGLPTTFIIARNGRAVGLAVGPRDWSGTPARELIRVLLGGTSAGK